MHVFNNYAAWLTDLAAAAPLSVTGGNLKATLEVIGTEVTGSDPTIGGPMSKTAAAETWVTATDHELAIVSDLSDGDFVGIAFKHENFKVDVLAVTAANTGVASPC